MSETRPKPWENDPLTIEFREHPLRSLDGAVYRWAGTSFLGFQRLCWDGNGAPFWSTPVTLSYNSAKDLTRCYEAVPA